MAMVQVLQVPMTQPMLVNVARLMGNRIELLLRHLDRAGGASTERRFVPWHDLAITPHQEELVRNESDCLNIVKSCVSASYHPWFPCSTVQHASLDEWADFLPQKVENRYESLMHYLETYYSLLRAECFIPLSTGIRQLTGQVSQEVGVTNQCTKLHWKAELDSYGQVAGVCRCPSQRTKFHDSQ